jgi:hypothetical protein
MKKFLVYSFGLILCLTFGCKKNDKNQKTYLLRQQIIDYRPANFPVDTITYTYDGHDRITMITDPTGQSKGNYSISYNADGNVNTARRLSDSGTLLFEYDYFYTPAAKGYYFYGTAHPRDTAVFTFNDKNQVTRVQSKRSGYSAYTYDSKGNVATVVGVQGNGSSGIYDNITYTYDTQKSPFSQIPPGNYLFMYIANNDASTFINNIQFKNGDTYTYTYNSDGFPVKGNINIGSAVIPVTFSYIVK